MNFFQFQTNFFLLILMSKPHQKFSFLLTNPTQIILWFTIFFFARNYSSLFSYYFLIAYIKSQITALHIKKNFFFFSFFSSKKKDFIAEWKIIALEYYKSFFYFRWISTMFQYLWNFISSVKWKVNFSELSGKIISVLNFQGIFFESKYS